MVVKERSVSVILLAGGKGKRMGVSSFHICHLSFVFLYLESWICFMCEYRKLGVFLVVITSLLIMLFCGLGVKYYSWGGLDSRWF